MRAKKPFDPVARPKHYNTHPSGVECITVAKWHSFAVGSAFKYLWRAGKKGAALQDLRKAAQCLAFEIERVEQVEAARLYTRKLRAAERAKRAESEAYEAEKAAAEKVQRVPRRRFP